MANDWIKMRVDLQTHPKVVRILSATRADKFRVIGGLHAVWSVFDTHSVDGLLQGYTPEALDHIIGWEGFADAMIAVGWLAYDGANTLKMPEFTEHNGQSAKRRAEDQKRKRDARRPHSVRTLSADEQDEKLDKKRTEEKRREREEKRVTPPHTPPQAGGGESDATPKPLTADDLVAEGVAKELAAEWLALRKRKRAPLTPLAWEAIKREATKAGITPAQAVEIANARGWQGFDAGWITKGTSTGQGRPVISKQDALEQRNAEVARRVLQKIKSEGENHAHEDTAGTR